MLLQFARLAVRESAPLAAFKRNFSLFGRKASPSTACTLNCKCNGCVSRFHSQACRCMRCYTTGTTGTTTTTTTSNNGKEEKVTAEEIKADDRDTKLAQLQDSYLRCLADMENLRNRTKKEVESASAFAIQKFCKDIVSVADVLELALGSVKDDPRTAQLLKGQQENVEESDTPGDASDLGEAAVLQLSKEELTHRLKDLSTGLSMTLSEMIKVFARHGLTAIDPLHQKFDPNVHMAMYEVNNPDLDAGTVIAVQKKGYILNHRVIRPASVGVSKKD